MNGEIKVTGRILQISQATRDLNPDVFPVAKLRPQKPQPNEWGQGQDRPLETGPTCLNYCVTITVYRRRLLDGHDNAAAACKQLVDAITRALGFTDDTKLVWRYHQIKSREQGTHVLITSE